MRFLFVDRILKMEKGKCAEGIKNVSFSDEYLINIAPNFPVLPRSLSVEAIAQLISWLVIVTKDFTVKPVAVMTDFTEFSGDARPGDQMVLKAEIKSMNEDDAVCSGRVEINGKVTTELKNGICAFIPLDDLENISVVKDVYRAISGNTTIEDFINYKKTVSETGNNSENNKFTLNVVDKVLEIENGKSILGTKSFTMTEEFGADHFPKKPVMPGTMMIEAFSQLSERLIASTVLEKTGSIIKIVPIQSRKIKFRKYVVPGDQLLIDIKLMDLKDDSALVKAKATVDGKVATSAQIEFAFIRL